MRSCMRFCVARSPALIDSSVTLVTPVCAISRERQGVVLLAGHVGSMLPGLYFLELAPCNVPIMPVLCGRRLAGVPDRWESMN